MYYLIRKLMYHPPPGVAVKYSSTNIMLDQLFKFAMQRYSLNKNAFHWFESEDDDVFYLSDIIYGRKDKHLSWANVDKRLKLWSFCGVVC
ncbi:hypothetical protein K7X08_011281 [Anisodus acutangulus]|uniref:Uncharacterized protein n=1 Tax=Anisodus acutangulus TaxID=402998 RepID=A0A9Q1M0A7_9SOLA|nr:hypothetical protein K7X08_011281 [Anisodus acutangulus]